MKYAVQLTRIYIFKDAELALTKSIELPFVPSQGVTLELQRTPYDEMTCDSVRYSIWDGAIYIEQHPVNVAIASCDCTPDDHCPKCVMQEDDERAYAAGSPGEWAAQVRRGYDRLYPFDEMYEPDKWAASKPMK